MNADIAPVLDEIAAVLKKHDMAGLVIVADRKTVDFRMEISPSWSCARVEENSGEVGIRIYSRLVDYPSVEAQKQCLTETIGTFVTFTDVLKRLEENLGNLLVKISKSVGFDGKSTES